MIKILLLVLLILGIPSLLPKVEPLVDPILIPVLVEQIDGKYVWWNYIIVSDVREYPIWCSSTRENVVGCANYLYRVMLIEDSFYQSKGMDVFTHEYIHARCDYDSSNWHLNNTHPVINKSPDVYWNTCGD